MSKRKKTAPKTTWEEVEAFFKKAENPSLNVLCPRCGSELTYFRFTGALTVYCTGCDLQLHSRINESEYIPEDTEGAK